MVKTNIVKSFLKQTPIYLSAIVLGIILGMAIQMAYAAWTNPTTLPPNNNAPAPINVSTTTQTKAGNLNIGGDLSVDGKICIGGVCKSSWPNSTVGVSIYKIPWFCENGTLLTDSPTCQTVLCYYWSNYDCNGHCVFGNPRTCNNTLIGHLLP